MKASLCLLSFLLIGQSPIASACSRASRGYDRDVNTFIALAQTIVLVDAESAQDSHGRDVVKLRESESLIDTLSVSQQQRVYHLPVYRESEFQKHTAEIFWNRPIGRAAKWEAGECYPSWGFTPGKRYLLFADFDSLSNPKAAELIESDDDQWLKYVRAGIAKRPGSSAEKPASSSPAIPPNDVAK